MNEPKVSVVLAIYNHENFVGETIESVIAQTFTDWELIIIDDASTDRSAEIARGYRDGRIRFYQAETNRGSVRTFNELLRKAKGEYVAFIGSDDVWEAGKLQEQTDFLERHEETAVCFSWAEFIDEEGRTYSSQEKECDCDIRIFEQENRTQGECLRHLFDGANYFCHPSALIRSRVVKEIGEFDPRFRQLHDLDYWIRVIQRHPVHVIQKPLVRYRRLGTENNSMSAVNRRNVTRFLNEMQTIVHAMMKEMSREVFCEAFQDLLKKEVTSEERLICEKYFVLLGWRVMGINNRQAAFRFLDDYMEESVIECLEREYRYSLNDYYEELGNVWELYPSDFHPEYEKLEQKNQELWKAYRAQEKVVDRLNGEIRGMSQTVSWKITKPLREVKKIRRRLARGRARRGKA